MAPSLQIVEENRVTRITLNRPDVHNAFDDALISELTAALMRADADPALRAVVLSGAGASFSAGADLNWMRGMAKAGELENRADSERLALLMRTLNFLSKPTIARVNGAAYGGGVGLIACCDIAIAADTAKFGLTEVRLGLVPAAISPYVIAAIGARHARCRRDRCAGSPRMAGATTARPRSSTPQSNARSMRSAGAARSATRKLLALRMGGKVQNA
jgi:methylglutaconyl-CoA hydratase